MRSHQTHGEPLRGNLAIRNPYTYGKPLKDSRLFFGREDVFAFLRQTLVGQHLDHPIILYGQQRTGKTSILYQMDRHLEARYVCALLDLHSFALVDLASSLWELATAITQSLRRKYQIELPSLDKAKFQADPRGIFEGEFLARTRAAIGGRYLLLMLDEATRLHEQVQAQKLDPDIFRYLRHLMEEHHWLNFLFVLNTGLEEMTREYALLFSVGVYKKISFLEPAAATALITQPVRSYYRVDESTQQMILDVTSGHPYYIQLLSHQLFWYWQQTQGVSIDAARDAPGLLRDALEQGGSLLKQTWEESNLIEGVVLASMAATMRDRNHRIKPQDVIAACAAHEITIGADEVDQAARSLLARDILTGHLRYRFAVDLQRLWLREHQPLLRMKADHPELAHRLPTTAPPPRSNRVLQGIGASLMAMGVILFLCFAFLGGYMFGIGASESPTESQATFSGFLMVLWAAGMLLTDGVLTLVLVIRRKHGWRQSLAWLPSGTTVALLLLSAGLGAFFVARSMYEAPTEEVSNTVLLGGANIAGGILSLFLFGIPGAVLLLSQRPTLGRIGLGLMLACAAILSFYVVTNMFLIAGVLTWFEGNPLENSESLSVVQEMAVDLVSKSLVVLLVIGLPGGLLFILDRKGRNRLAPSGQAPNR